MSYPARAEGLVNSTLFKLVNATFILAFSSYLVLTEFSWFLVGLQSGALGGRCLGWCGHRNFLTAKTFSFLCGIVQIPVARWGVFYHYLFQALDVGLCFEFEALWNEEKGHKITTASDDRGWYNVHCVFSVINIGSYLWGYSKPTIVLRVHHQILVEVFLI